MDGTSLLTTRSLASFRCLGERCEDTCCKGWSMQVDDATLQRYKYDAPELLEAVEQAGEAPWIMRKNAAGACVKFENGLCGIHKEYGENFLGDACYFYPRVTRRLGDKTLMTGMLSCPEIARLGLAGDDACDWQEGQAERLPQTLKDYLPVGMEEESAFAVHRAFVDAVREDVSAERAVLRIAHVAWFLPKVDQKSWAQAVPFYLGNAESLLPAAERNPADPFNLLHALAGLITASRRPPSERLKQTVADMEKALQATLDWKLMLIYADDRSLASYRQLQAGWQEEFSAVYAPVLRRWLRMQLSFGLYPFAGLGETFAERITLIGVRLATLKLALMCTCGVRGAALPEEEVIRIVQSMARLLDHLADAKFSLQIYGETGWTRDTRLRGLLEG